MTPIDEDAPDQERPGPKDDAGRIRLAARTPMTAKRHENRAGGVEVRATVGWLAKAAQH